MRKLFAISACLILLSLIVIPRSTVYSQRRDTDRPRYADDRIVVKMKAQLPYDDDLMAAEIVRSPGVRAEGLGTRRRDIQLIHLNRNVSVEEAVRRANEDPRVEYAEPDYFVYEAETTPNDGFFTTGLMWGLSAAGCSPSLCDSHQPAPS